jgi:hypothetical protein
LRRFAAKNLLTVENDRENQPAFLLRAFSTSGRLPRAISAKIVFTEIEKSKDQVKEAASEKG